MELKIPLLLCTQCPICINYTCIYTLFETQALDVLKYGTHLNKLARTITNTSIYFPCMQGDCVIALLSLLYTCIYMYHVKCLFAMSVS